MGVSRNYYIIWLVTILVFYFFDKKIVCKILNKIQLFLPSNLKTIFTMHYCEMVFYQTQTLLVFRGTGMFHLYSLASEVLTKRIKWTLQKLWNWNWNEINQPFVLWIVIIIIVTVAKWHMHIPRCKITWHESDSTRGSISKR